MCSWVISPSIGVSITAGAMQLTRMPVSATSLPIGLRERDHGRLARGVGARHRVPLLARDRGDVDDPAVAARRHAADRGAVRVEDAVRVDREHALPLLVLDVDRLQRLRRRRRRSRRARRARRARRRRARRPRRGRPSATTSPAIARSASAPSTSRSNAATRAPPSASRRHVARADAARAARDERDTAGEVVGVRSGHGPSCTTVLGSRGGDPRRRAVLDPGRRRRSRRSAGAHPQHALARSGARARPGRRGPISSTCGSCSPTGPTGSTGARRSGGSTRFAHFRAELDGVRDPLRPRAGARAAAGSR